MWAPANDLTLVPVIENGTSKTMLRKVKVSTLLMKIPTVSMIVTTIMTAMMIKKPTLMTLRMMRLTRTMTMNWYRDPFTGWSWRNVSNTRPQKDINRVKRPHPKPYHTIHQHANDWLHLHLLDIVPNLTIRNQAKKCDSRGNKLWTVGICQGRLTSMMNLLSPNSEVHTFRF